MQSMTALFRGVDTPQRIGEVPFDSGSVGSSIDVSPDEREIFLSVESGDRTTRIVAVDLASAESRSIAKLPSPVRALHASPYGPGELLAVLRGSDERSSSRSGAVRIETRTGSVHPLPSSTSRAQWKQVAWWGRGHVLGIEARPVPADENGAHGGRAMWADLAAGTVHPITSVPARSVGGSPDGRWAVLADADRDVWIVHVPSGERRLLAGVGREEVSRVEPNPSFTPDGRGVLMKSDRFGSGEIVLTQLPDFTALPLPYERAARRRQN